MIKLAQKPLPDSNLFRNALSSADALDETEVELWDCDPPYSHSLSMTIDCADDHYTGLMVEVLNGRRLRQRRALLHSRFALLSQSGGTDIVVDQLNKIIHELENRWKFLEGQSFKHPNVRSSVMAHSATEWCAKDQLAASQELQLLAQSTEAYRNAYTTNSLFYLCINVSICKG